MLDTILPLLAALVAGSLIGLERGSRSEPAGFRTHALVCLAAAASVVAARRAGDALGDPAAASRIAQGVVTGIGFLGAGVIVRENVSVHGLTTAASIWGVAALGTVFGFSAYPEGIAATVLLYAVLYALRPLDKKLPRHGLAELTVRYAKNKALTEGELSELLAGLGISMSMVDHHQELGVVEHHTLIHAEKLVPVEALAATLGKTAGVSGFDIVPRSI